MKAKSKTYQNLPSEICLLILCRLVERGHNYNSLIAQKINQSPQRIHVWTKKAIKKGLIRFNNRQTKPIFYEITEHGLKYLDRIPRERADYHISNLNQKVSIHVLLEKELSPLRDFKKASECNVHHMAIGMKILAPFNIEKYGGFWVYKDKLKTVKWYKRFNLKGYRIKLFPIKKEGVFGLLLTHCKTFYDTNFRNAEIKAAIEGNAILERWLLRTNLITSRAGIVQDPEYALQNRWAKTIVGKVGKAKIHLDRGIVMLDESHGAEIETTNIAYAENMQENSDSVYTNLQTVKDFSQRNIFQDIDKLSTTVNETKAYAHEIKEHRAAIREMKEAIHELRDIMKKIGDKL